MIQSRTVLRREHHASAASDLLPETCFPGRFCFQAHDKLGVKRSPSCAAYFFVVTFGLAPGSELPRRTVLVFGGGRRVYESRLSAVANEGGVDPLGRNEFVTFSFFKTRLYMMNMVDPYLVRP